nr:uncharacterized protein [Bombyx mori]
MSSSNDKSFPAEVIANKDTVHILIDLLKKFVDKQMENKATPKMNDAMNNFDDNPVKINETNMAAISKADPEKRFNTGDNMKPNCPHKTKPLAKDKNSKKNKSKTISRNNKTHPLQIPCQSVSDILDDAYVLRKQSQSNQQALGNRIESYKQSNTLTQETNGDAVPVPKLKISCTESDDAISIVFKPKTISLMQVYGNLLKKITVTALVPYHVSKLVY